MIATVAVTGWSSRQEGKKIQAQHEWQHRPSQNRAVGNRRERNPNSRNNKSEQIEIFGHLHYAKTAGTEINGLLAAKYERVCGHKGYNYDAYQFNTREAERRKRKRKLLRTELRQQRRLGEEEHNTITCRIGVKEW